MTNPTPTYDSVTVDSGIFPPSWTTSARPGSPTLNQTGFNSTIGGLETWNGSAWVGASTGTDEWNAGTVNAVGANLSIVSNTLIASAGTGAPGGVPGNLQFDSSGAFGGVTGTAVAPPSNGTDDTSALQSILGSISSAGAGRLILQSPVYFTTGLVVPSNCWIDSAAGENGTILRMVAGTTTANNAVLMGSASINSISGNSYSLFGILNPTTSQGVQGVKISNITIDGNKANSAQCDGIAIYGFAWTIENVEIENCTGDGLHTEYGVIPGAVETNNTQSFAAWLEAHDCNAHGIRFGGPSDTVFLGCNSYRNLLIDLWLTAPAGTVKWIGGHCWSSDVATARQAVYACQIDTASNLLMGSHFEGATSAQIWNRGNGNVITGCFEYYNQSNQSTAQSGYVHGDVGTASFTGALSIVVQNGVNVGVLTASSVTGTLRIGMPLAGTGVTSGQTIAGFGTGLGGAGTYYTSIAQTLSSRAMTASGVAIIGNRVDLWAENVGAGAVSFVNDGGDNYIEFFGISGVSGAFGYAGTHNASTRVKGTMYGAPNNTSIWYEPTSYIPIMSVGTVGIGSPDGTSITISGGVLSATGGGGGVALTNGTITAAGTLTFSTGLTLTGSGTAYTLTSTGGFSGGTVSGATTFSAAGTALTVNNDAHVGGNLTLSNPLAPNNGGLGFNAASVLNGHMPIGDGSGYIDSIITGTANNLIVTPGSGTLSLQASANQIPGTATNDAASTGNLGEYVPANVPIGSAVSLAANTTANVTSISLTAGDWDVSGNVIFVAAGSTVIGTAIAAISQVSATLPTAPNGGGYAIQFPDETNPGLVPVLTVGPMRISLASTTTIYLLANCGFNISTCGAAGFIGARRAR